jgi:hypothetical protein
MRIDCKAFGIMVFLCALFIGCNDPSEVQSVKNGYLTSYPGITIGKAIDGFFASPEWSSGKADDGLVYVNAKGKITYLDKEIEAIIQFKINDDESFEINAVEFNGIPQNQLMIAGLISKIFEFADIEMSSIDESSNNETETGILNENVDFQVHASSVYTGDKSFTYTPDIVLAKYGYNMGAWVEGNSSSGIGEWIELVAPIDIEVSSIYIYPGVQLKSESGKNLYYENSRPSSITVTCDNNYTFVSRLEDTEGQQEIVFDSKVKTKRIRITINEIYQGKCNDTGITSLTVMGKEI